MRKSTNLGAMSSSPSQRSGAALLWDESFLWGSMAVKALQKAGLAFDLIRADEIERGCLEKHALLFVPGGWSSNKMKALGETGVEAVKKFVYEGGNYLGFCGGAGLATLDGIGLLNIRRKPTKERVPSFSGRIRVRVSGHPAFNNIGEPVFHAWWPPQFAIEDKSVNVLATYQEPMPDAFSSDLNVGDVEEAGSWSDLEQLYQINLNPKRLFSDPAVVEGGYGSGRVLLSLVHFDTLDDRDSIQVLKNLWDHLGGERRDAFPPENQDCQAPAESGNSPASEISALVSAVSGIIDLGARNFLWFWRNPMLLQWRRGVRGLEYCTLYIVVLEIAAGLQRQKKFGTRPAIDDLHNISSQLIFFSERAKRLLVLERLAIQNGHITYQQCDDPEIRKIREELFSSSKSYGGLFKEILDRLDAILYILIEEEQKRFYSVQ